MLVPGPVLVVSGKPVVMAGEGFLKPRRIGDGLESPWVSASSEGSGCAVRNREGGRPCWQGPCLRSSVRSLPAAQGGSPGHGAGRAERGRGRGAFLRIPKNLAREAGATMFTRHCCSGKRRPRERKTEKLPTYPVIITGQVRG